MKHLTSPLLEADQHLRNKPVTSPYTLDTNSHQPNACRALVATGFTLHYCHCEIEGYIDGIPLCEQHLSFVKDAAIDPKVYYSAQFKQVKAAAKANKKRSKISLQLSRSNLEALAATTDPNLKELATKATQKLSA